MKVVLWDTREEFNVETYKEVFEKVPGKGLHVSFQQGSAYLHFSLICDSEGQYAAEVHENIA